MICKAHLISAENRYLVDTKFNLVTALDEHSDVGSSKAHHTVIMHKDLQHATVTVCVREVIHAE